MENIVYHLNGKAYLNITNQCPCNCSFCIRKTGKKVGTGENLWLEREPDYDEILEEITKCDWKEGEEVTFCGFGEPTCALENMLRAAGYLKQTCRAKIRVNTNGLGNLFHNDNITDSMKGLVDVVSISLNASNAVKYQAIVKSKYGEQAFDEMLKFAAQCKEAGIHTCFTVVDVIGEEEIQRCQAIAEQMGISFRVRKYIKNSEKYA